jgi:hypothetical protein
MLRQNISPDLLQIAPLILRSPLSFEDSLLRLGNAIQCNTRSVNVRIRILLLVSLSWLVSSLQNHVQINLLRLQWTIQTGTIECAAWTHTKAVFVSISGSSNFNCGGKGYLPWLSDGPRLSGQGVSVLGPSLPPFYAPT